MRSVDSVVRVPCNVMHIMSRHGFADALLLMCMLSAGLEGKLAEIAGRRKLEDLSIGPVLTWTTQAMLHHVDRLLQIPGAPSSP